MAYLFSTAVGLPEILHADSLADLYAAAPILAARNHTARVDSPVQITGILGEHRLWGLQRGTNPWPEVRNGEIEWALKHYDDLGISVFWSSASSPYYRFQVQDHFRLLNDADSSRFGRKALIFNAAKFNRVEMDYWARLIFNVDSFPINMLISRPPHLESAIPRIVEPRILKYVNSTFMPIKPEAARVSFTALLTKLFGEKVATKILEKF